MPILSCQGEGKIVNTANGKVSDGRGGVIGTCACVDIPSTRTGRSHWYLHRTVANHSDGERSVNVSDGTADMNADGKSDDFVVPLTRTNKAATAVAEPAEERKSPKGSVTELSPMSQTLSWIWHQSEQHGKPRLVEPLCDSIV